MRYLVWSRYVLINRSPAASPRKFQICLIGVENVNISLLENSSDGCKETIHVRRLQSSLHQDGGHISCQEFWTSWILRLLSDFAHWLRRLPNSEPGYQTKTCVQTSLERVSKKSISRSWSLVTRINQSLHVNTHALVFVRLKKETDRDLLIFFQDIYARKL